jgi:hypothetical protein
MTEPSSDRRRHRRHGGNDRVIIDCRRDSPDDGPNLALALLDVSNAGVRLYLREPVECEDIIHLSLEVEGLFAPYQSRGTVRWAVEREGGYCIAGVELEKGLDDAEVNALGSLGDEDDTPILWVEHLSKSKRDAATGA